MIDKTNWEEFKLCDILEIESMSGKDESNFNEEGDIPLIIAKKDENGVGFRIKNGKKLFSANKIVMVKTGDGGAGLSFYQGKKFYATSSVMILRENRNIYNWILNKNIGIFLVTVMKKFKKEFSHSNSINLTKYNSLVISLPSQKHQPDWEYMDNFVKNVRSRVVGGGDDLIAKIIYYTIYDDDWINYKISDIFDVCTTKTRELKNYKEGNIPFVSGTSVNNGVEKFVTTDEELEKGNCITVSSLDYSAFYQEKDFIGRGHGVVQRLYNENLNKNTALFICPIIKKLGIKYNYSNQCFLNNLKNEIICLPSFDGKPDWEYMDKFIQSIIF